MRLLPWPLLGFLLAAEALFALLSWCNLQSLPPATMQATCARAYPGALEGLAVAMVGFLAVGAVLARHEPRGTRLGSFEARLAGAVVAGAAGFVVLLGWCGLAPPGGDCLADPRMGRGVLLAAAMAGAPVFVLWRRFRRARTPPA